MDEFLKDVKPGQPLMAKDGTYFHAVNPSLSDNGKSFTVSDDNGRIFTTNNIDIEASKELLNARDDDRIIFSKFRIPKDAKAVQAALIYSKDDGKTWSDQIPAELTIAKPDVIPYLEMDNSPGAGAMKTFGHSLIENVWRDGFNTCLELFMTGQVAALTPDNITKEDQSNA